MASAHLHCRSSCARPDRARFGWLASGILLVQASVLLLPLFASPAAAACSTSGTMVTCASGSNTNNVSSSVDDVTVNVQSSAILSVPPLLGGSSLTLNGNGITLNNQGSIDPTINGGFSLPADGAVIGNSAANTININNETGGVINGLINIASLNGFAGQALVVQNGSGGVATIQNAGSIGMSIFGVGSNTTADAPAVVAYGGGQVKFTNTGTITGRIGFEAPGTAGVGNTFLNAGTINGSVYLGNSAAGNTFTAVSGSSVNNAGVATASTMNTGAATVNFAAAGIVDAGTGTNNTLVLQNSATGPGSGTGGAVTTISASNYLDFQKLVVNSGTWNLQGNVVSGSATLNDGLVNFNSSGAFGSGAIQVSGGAIAASSAGLSVANAVSLNAGNLTLQGNNNLTLTGVISGAGGLIKDGASTLTLNGANLFTGGLTVNAGTVALGAGGSLAATGAVNLAGLGAGFDISAAGNQAIGSLSGVAGSTMALGGNTLTLGGVGNSVFGGSITGGGGLIKNGAGTQTLNGASTFSGGVTLNAGGLLLGNNSALGTGALTVGGNTTLDGSAAVTLANDIVLNGGLTLLGAQAVTLGGAITGVGSLTKDGAAILTLTGTNFFTGGLFINAGTVAMGAGGSLSSFAVVSIASGGGFDISTGGNQTIGSVIGGAGSTVALGANTLTLNAGNNSAFGGSIGGTGSLVQDGIGTLTLTGANGFTGGLVINAGSVTLGAGGSLAATGAVNLAGAGTGFDISAAGNQTIGSLFGVAGATVTLGGNTLTLGGVGNASFGGAISGTGSLAKDGSGTQILTGAIIYNGSTTVNGGTLEIGNGGSIAQSASLTNSANFTVDSGGFATFGSVTNNVGGTITNNGTITDDLNNAGTVTNNGTYVANVASNTGTIINNSIWTGTIITSGTFTNTTGATVSGLVTNSGTGSNAGTLSGGLTNTAGTFNNTGTIGGTTTVSGGTLFGTGSTGTLNITNGGAFAPGNGTPGTFATVNGSLALTSGAFYVVGLNPTTASFANVSGTATLGGASVLALFSSGSYVVKQYTILNATGGVSGTFNTLANTNLPAGFASTLSYDATHAYLNLALNLTPSGPSAPANGSNGNQRNVAATIVNFFNANGFIPIAFGMLTPAGLRQVSGELATGSQQTTFNAMTQFMGVMSDPFIAGRGDDPSAGGGATGYADDASAYAARRKPNDALAAIYTKAPPVAPFEARWSTWAAGFGGSQNTDGNAVAGSNNTTSSVYGTAVGADYRFSPFTIAGFALAGGGTAFSVNGSGSGHSDLFQAGAFVRHDVGPLYISAALAYGWQDITTNRTVTVAGADQLHAEFNANAFSGRVESGYRFVTPFAGGLGITPYAAGQFTTFDLPSYAESALSGAGTFALAYNARSVTDTRSELGIRTDKSFVVQGGILTLRSRFAWAHDYDPDRSIAATFQSLPGASFFVNGAAQASDSALTTASAEMKWSSGWSVSGTFEGEFSSVTNSYAGKGVVRYVW
jgi:autotransporter-associated beta strand protein